MQLFFSELFRLKNYTKTKNGVAIFSFKNPYKAGQPYKK
jgi:hypothetical protein